MSLEGANCADLPAFVVDKYFNCNVRREPLLAMAAKAICGNCVVREDCLSAALSLPSLQSGGVIGGVAAVEVHAARSWRAYEQGMTDALSKRPRPAWLAMTDATNDLERLRLELDPDEDAAEVVRRPMTRPAISHPSQLGVRASTAPKRQTPRPKRAPSLQYFNVDVPVPLPDASCAAMPSELVVKYFNADVLRQRAAAEVAQVVCAHCPIIETCFNRALNGSSVRKSGVIAGMGARELERGRLWLRYERGTANKVPTSPRPSWLPQDHASEGFRARALGQVEGSSDARLPRIVVNSTSTKRDV